MALTERKSQRKQSNPKHGDDDSMIRRSRL